MLVTFNLSTYTYLLCLFNHSGAPKESRQQPWAKASTVWLLSWCLSKVPEIRHKSMIRRILSMTSLSQHPDHASPDCRVTKGRGREASQNLAKLLVEAQSRAGFPLWPLQGGRPWNTADCSSPLLLTLHGTGEYKYREYHRSCLSLEVHLFSFWVFLRSYLNFCSLETNPYVSVGILWFLLAKKNHSTRADSGLDSPLQILVYAQWMLLNLTSCNLQQCPFWKWITKTVFPEILIILIF